MMAAHAIRGTDILPQCQLRKVRRVYLCLTCSMVFEVVHGDFANLNKQACANASPSPIVAVACLLTVISLGKRMLNGTPSSPNVSTPYAICASFCSCCAAGISV